MANYYFTFCGDHPVYSGIICKVSVQTLDDSYSEARRKFCSKFGTAWCGQYSEEEAVKFPESPWWIPSVNQFVDFDKLPKVPPKRIANLSCEEIESAGKITNIKDIFIKCGWTEDDLKSLEKFGEMCGKSLDYLLLAYL